MIQHPQEVANMAVGGVMVTSSLVVEVGNLAQAVGFVLGCVLIAMQIWVLYRDKFK